jgi:membrane protein
MRLSARRIREVLFEGTAHFFESHGFVYSAAIAFNLLLASIPVLFLVFAATSALIGRNELPFETLATILKETFPYGAQVLVPILKELFAKGTTFGIAGSLMLLLASFSATDAVHTSLAVMQGSRLEKTFRRSALFHVILVLTLIVLTSSAILAPHLWAGIVYLTQGFSVGWDTAFQLLLSGIAEAFLAGIIFLAGALTYRYLSPRRVQMENALAGSLMFLFLLYVIKTGFVFYVKRFSRLNIIYGSLFSIICFIIMAYLFAVAYLFCASIIGTLERKEGKEDFPGREQGAGTDGAAGGD